MSQEPTTEYLIFMGVGAEELKWHSKHDHVCLPFYRVALPVQRSITVVLSEVYHSLCISTTAVTAQVRWGLAKRPEIP